MKKKLLAIVGIVASWSIWMQIGKSLILAIMRRDNLTAAEMEERIKTLDIPKYWVCSRFYRQVILGSLSVFKAMCREYPINRYGA